MYPVYVCFYRLWFIKCLLNVFAMFICFEIYLFTNWAIPCWYLCHEEDLLVCCFTAIRWNSGLRSLPRTDEHQRMMIWKCQITSLKCRRVGTNDDVKSYFKGRHLTTMLTRLPRGRKMRLNPWTGSCTLICTYFKKVYEPLVEINDHDGLSNSPCLSFLAALGLSSGIASFCETPPIQINDHGCQN